VRHHLRHETRPALYVVHRIDRDTSGLVLFARTAEARDALKAQFERRTPLRVYQAVVEGIVRPPRGMWSDQLAWDARTCASDGHGTDARGKEAVAEYAVLEQFESAALVKVSLVTGKRNQIRVQAGVRGHPLLGERQYRFGAPAPAPGLPRIGRQALHACASGSAILDRPADHADGRASGGLHAPAGGASRSTMICRHLPWRNRSTPSVHRSTWPITMASRCPTRAGRAARP